MNFLRMIPRKSAAKCRVEYVRTKKFKRIGGYCVLMAVERTILFRNNFNSTKIKGVHPLHKLVQFFITTLLSLADGFNLDEILVFLIVFCMMLQIKII